MSKPLFLSIMCVASAVVLPASAATVVFRDDFNGELLPGWHVVHESPDKVSLTDRSGFLRVETERGTIAADSHVNNIHLRDVTGDFILDSRIEFDPEAGQQYAGLIVYLDDQNAVSIGLAYAAGERGVFRGIVMLTVENGEAPTGTPPVAFYNADNTPNPKVVFLRLLRRGDKLVGGFSSDGKTYNDIGTIVNPLPAAISVGLGAANGDGDLCGPECDQSIPADFDYFQISTLEGGTNGEPNVDVVLDRVDISGPDSLSAGGTADYVAIAHFSDDTTLNATADAEWTVAPAGTGQIDQGHFTAAAVASTRQVTLVATYTQLTSDGEVIKHGAKVVRVNAAASGGGGLCGAGAAGAAALGTVSVLFAAARRRVAHIDISHSH